MVAPLEGVSIPSITDLQRNAARLLQQSLAEAAQTVAPAELTARDLQLARSNVAALSFVVATGLHGAYRYLRDFIARQAVPAWSTAEFLDGWLETYGMARKGAAVASGTVVGTGVPAATAPAGSLLQADDGRQYVTITDAVVDGAGELALDVAAVVAGAAGNLAGGTTLRFVSALTGVDADAEVDTAGLTGGVDVESDSDAVYRLQQRLANEPRGGCPADYARWALEVPGITRAWGVRSPAGPTSAGVIIMADGNGGAGLPTTLQRDQVMDYIRDPLRGPPDELFVVIPTPQVINVALSVQPDSLELRTQVQAALADLFFREAVPGGAIPHSHLTEAISTVVGEYNHVVVSPSIVSGGMFTVSGWDKLLVLGTVTWS